jgi:hypothetical protein
MPRRCRKSAFVSVIRHEVPESEPQQKPGMWLQTAALVPAHKTASLGLLQKGKLGDREAAEPLKPVIKPEQDAAPCLPQQEAPKPSLKAQPSRAGGSGEGGEFVEEPTLAQAR